MRGAQHREVLLDRLEADAPEERVRLLEVVLVEQARLDEVGAVRLEEPAPARLDRGDKRTPRPGWCNGCQPLTTWTSLT